MIDVKSKEKISVALLKSVVQDVVPLIVNFSGGKDSLVCLMLALEASDNVECLFMDSGQELPNTLAYVEKQCKRFAVPLNVSHPCRDRVQHKRGGVPEHTCLLPDYIRHWGYFPTSVYRYCSCWLKHRPGRIFCRKKWGFAELYKIVGIRLDESGVRGWRYGSDEACKKFGGREIRPDSEHSGSFMVMPILDWTKKDVQAFLENKKIELHEGYKLFGMSGCKWCPVAKPGSVQRIARVYPGIYDELVKVEEEIKKPAWFHKKIWLRDLIKNVNV